MTRIGGTNYKRLASYLQRDMSELQAQLHEINSRTCEGCVYCTVACACMHPRSSAHQVELDFCCKYWEPAGKKDPKYKYWEDEDDEDEEDDDDD